MRTTTLSRYELPDDGFVPWAEADGQWISEVELEPLAVEPVGDLLDVHGEAGIELRRLESLWPLRDEVAASSWPFSIIRMVYAGRRR